MAQQLTQQTCVPCSGSLPPATSAEVAELHRQIPGWNVVKAEGISKLQRHYKFKNFAAALAFTNEVGRIAEAAGHHPVLTTAWGKVTVTWWTHAISGLHRNDFVMAARTDAIISSSD